MHGFVERVLDERTARKQKKLGWNTTLKSKPLMVNNLRELVREGSIAVRSKEILHEMSAFAHHADGKMAAQSGRHDDCVIALGIAVMMAHMYPPSIMQQRAKRTEAQKDVIPLFQYQ